MSALYEETQDKIKLLKEAGYMVEYIWESEWKYLNKQAKQKERTE